MLNHVSMTNNKGDVVGNADIESHDLIQAGAIAEDIEATFYALNSQHDFAIKKIELFDIKRHKK